MKKKLSALLLALTLCFSISVPAFAYEEFVSQKNSVGNYQIWSELYKDGNRYNASTWVQAKSGNIPARGVMVQAILYDDLGTVKQSSMSTLTSEYYFHVVDTQYRSIREGRARSQGIVYVRDSSGDYLDHKTSAALGPVSSRSISSKEEIAPIHVNVKGETYGSLLAAKTVADAPSLIAAIGTEGQHGYLRSEDFLSPDDCCGDSNYGSKYIPLYDLNGNVIGTFEITFSHPDTTNKDIATVRKQLATGNAEYQEMKVLADQVLVDGDYPVNSKGQTYGPEILRKLVGYSPDLTPAVNDDGIIGYISCAKELPITREDAEALIAATSKPLYDKDGNEIGTFELARPTPIQKIGKTVPEVRGAIAAIK